MKVCSTDFVHHTFLNPHDGQIESILERGLRPLSDFPDSERWKQIEQHLPGFFEKLYNEIAMPVLQKPHANSGIFVSPIDFQLLPGSLLYNKQRLKIPLARIDPGCAVLTYILDGKRISLPLTGANLEQTAERWNASMVMEWFAKDINRLFFYVPQIAVYQPQGIPIEAGDIEIFE